MTEAIDAVDMKGVKDEIKSVDNVNMEVYGEEVSGKRRMDVTSMAETVRDKNPDKMEVKDGVVAGVNSVKEMGELGMIEKERNGMENRNVARGEIDVVENIVGLKKLQEGTLQLATEGVLAKTPIGVEGEAMNDATQSKRLNLERAGAERLAKMESLAENERQAKIRRREELDRVARLQRILALVRAPELVSVPKIKQHEDLEIEKRIQSNKDINVLKELGVVTEMNTKGENVAVKETQQAVKPEVDVAQLVSKKSIAVYEGIEKLERMSTKERILEIDHLIKLELEAETKRKADFERNVKLEREAELQREEKMKQLKELHLKTELDKAEREHLAEQGRQEKIRRKEELDRVAKLQRVLVMVRASETDGVAEMKQAELERSVEKKRREDMKLLEVLGILPRHHVTEKDSATGVKAKYKPEIDTNLVEVAKPISVVKEEDMGPVTEMNQKAKLNEVSEVEKMTIADQLPKKDSEPKKEIRSETQKGAKINLVAENPVVTDNEVRRKPPQRIIAMVRNTEPDGVAHTKKDIELEKIKDLKRAEEIKLLQELGIVPKEQEIHKEKALNVKAAEKLNLEAQVHQTKDLNYGKTTNPVTEVNGDIDISIRESAKAQIETKSAVVIESEREAKIKRVTEIERNAKAKPEAKMKRREERERVANLQRVVALVTNEELDLTADMKKADLKQIVEEKHSEDMKVLEQLGIVSNKRVTQTESEIDLKEADRKDNSTKTTNVIDMKLELESEGKIEVQPENVENMPKLIIDTDSMTEKERMAVKEDLERRIAELRVAQMKRVAELGREMKVAISGLEEKEKGQMAETELAKTIAKEDKHVEPLEFKQPGIKTKVGIEHVSGMRLKEDLKSVVDLSLPDDKQNVIEKVKEIKLKEDSNSLANFGIPDVNQGLESEKKIQPESEMKLTELKHLGEMKRVVGMELVRGRDCEWDGQMMYVGRENL